jgi:hypothetical protein
VYAAQDETLGWSAFFTANSGRAQYLRDHFISDFAFTNKLWIPIAAAIAYWLISAFVQAPFFRAIVGRRYPLAPQNWREVGRLFLFYLLFDLLTWLTLLIPAEGSAANLALIVFPLLMLVGIVVVFADYVVVFEDLGLLSAMRRSFRLVRTRLLAVLLILWVFGALSFGTTALFDLMYGDGHKVFFLLPVGQILLDTVLNLAVSILLVFLYEDLRRQSPA